jgi:hypothetical protein
MVQVQAVIPANGISLKLLALLVLSWSHTARQKNKFSCDKHSHENKSTPYMHE